MMRRTSCSMWELLQSSSQVPFTSICFAKVISCFWLGTTKLITYDWSLWSMRFPSLQTHETHKHQAENELEVQAILQAFTCLHRHRCCQWGSSSSGQPPPSPETRIRQPAASPGPFCGLYNRARVKFQTGTKRHAASPASYRWSWGSRQSETLRCPRCRTTAVPSRPRRSRCSSCCFCNSPSLRWGRRWGFLLGGWACLCSNNHLKHKCTIQLRKTTLAGLFVFSAAVTGLSPSSQSFSLISEQTSGAPTRPVL